MGKEQETKAEANIIISAPNFKTLGLRIIGTAPYVMHRFGEKAMKQIRDKQVAGSQAKKGQKKESRDFDKEYLEALYQSKDGWHGMPAPSFRRAMISACRTVGFAMTLAK